MEPRCLMLVLLLYPGSDAVVTSLASTLTRSDTTLLAVGLQDASIQLLALHHQNLRCDLASAVQPCACSNKQTPCTQAAFWGCIVISCCSILTTTNSLRVSTGPAEHRHFAFVVHVTRAPDGSGIKSATILIRSTAADRAAQDNSTTPAVDNRPIQHLLFTK